MDKIGMNIPYQIEESGYHWTLIGIENDFSKPVTFVHAEYENQYGHIKRFDKNYFIEKDEIMNQIPDEGEYCLDCFCIRRKSCMLFNHKELKGMPYSRLPECKDKRPQIISMVGFIGEIYKKFIGKSDE